MGFDYSAAAIFDLCSLGGTVKTLKQDFGNSNTRNSQGFTVFVSKCWIISAVLTFHQIFYALNGVLKPRVTLG